MLDFNSIKVRLELIARSILNLRESSFQFHKGAIRTKYFGRWQVSFHSFQFHKGAIRTTGKCNTETSFDNFNSIKVRLEPCVISISAPEYNHHFNSIKVRLEREGVLKLATTEANLFQFHKGAIRTCLCKS